MAQQRTLADHWNNYVKHSKHPEFAVCWTLTKLPLQLYQRAIPCPCVVCMHLNEMLMKAVTRMSLNDEDAGNALHLLNVVTQNSRGHGNS